MANDKNKSLKTVGDIERAKQVARNDFNKDNEYGIDNTYLTVGGLGNDNVERNKQMGRSDYNGNNEYGIDKIDL